MKTQKHLKNNILNHFYSFSKISAQPGFAGMVSFQQNPPSQGATLRAADLKKSDGQQLKIYTQNDKKVELFYVPFPKLQIPHFLHNDFIVFPKASDVNLPPPAARSGCQKKARLPFPCSLVRCCSGLSNQPNAVRNHGNPLQLAVCWLWHIVV